MDNKRKRTKKKQDNNGQEYVRLSWLPCARRNNLRRAAHLIDCVAEAEEVGRRLSDCGRTVFLAPMVEGDFKLVGGHFCQLPRLCAICSVLRKGKVLRHYTLRVMKLLNDHRSSKVVLCTLTVLNGPDLHERALHVLSGVQRLLRRRADALSKGRGRTETRKVIGGVGQLHVAAGASPGWWNLHFHLVAVASVNLDQSALAAEWEEITKDSRIVDVRSLRVRRPLVPERLEVKLRGALAYITDLKGLNHDQAWQAHAQLAGLRLVRSFGALRGMDVSEDREPRPPHVERFAVTHRSIVPWRDRERRSPGTVEE